MSPWGWAANAVLVSGLWFVGNRLWWAFLLTAVGEVVWVVIEEEAGVDPEHGRQLAKPFVG